MERFPVRFAFLLIVIHFDSSFSLLRKMRTRQDGGPRLANLGGLVSNAWCGEWRWKRFHTDEQKYIPGLGLRQIESCAGVELAQAA
jgi:hypothetical protein